MELIYLEDAEKWDNVVKSFPNYDVYYLSGYVKAFEVHGDGKPFLLHYQDNNGGEAVCVLMLRDVATDVLFCGRIQDGVYFDAATPYGYGGFIYKDNVDTQTLAKEFREVLNELHVNSVFFRFHPVLNNAIVHKNIANVIPLGKTIAIDLSSPEIIWENIISKNRNMIRKAEKNNIEIHHSSDLELFEIFKDIYDETMRNDRAKDYYFFKEQFYESVAKNLNSNFEFFYATYEGIIISIAIIIFANKQMHYHLSGSLPEYRSLAPSNLLLYKAALWGHERGYKTFHLGGGVGSGEDSLYKFKAAFNRHSDYMFAIGKCIISPNEYDYLMNIRGFSREDAYLIKYFPQYRTHI